MASINSRRQLNGFPISSYAVEIGKPKLEAAPGLPRKVYVAGAVSMAAISVGLIASSWDFDAINGAGSPAPAQAPFPHFNLSQISSHSFASDVGDENIEVQLSSVSPPAEEPGGWVRGMKSTDIPGQENSPRLHLRAQGGSRPSASAGSNAQIATGDDLDASPTFPAIERGGDEPNPLVGDHEEARVSSNQPSRLTAPVADHFASAVGAPVRSSAKSGLLLDEARFTLLADEDDTDLLAEPGAASVLPLTASMVEPAKATTEQFAEGGGARGGIPTTEATRERYESPPAGRVMVAAGSSADDTEIESLAGGPVGLGGGANLSVLSRVYASEGYVSEDNLSEDNLSEDNLSEDNLSEGYVSRGELRPHKGENASHVTSSSNPPTSLISSDDEVADDALYVDVRAGLWVNGGDIGSIPMRISAEDLVSVRLTDLISLFEDHMERPLFVWLKSSESASEYVTLQTLRSAGIEVNIDPVGRRVELALARSNSP